MKFTLSRQLLPPELERILSREIQKQKLAPDRLSKRDLKDLVTISQIISKQALPPYLLCKKMPYNLGCGIFLHPRAQPLSKGKLLAPYSGELSLIPQTMPNDGSYAFTPVENIHLTKEEQARYDKNSLYRPNRLYLLKLDALKKGNFTRYINHSEKPNIIAYTLAIPSNPYGLSPSPIEVLYFTKRTIYPGEQLLVSYEDGEKSYWNGDLKPFPMTATTFHLQSKRGGQLRVHNECGTN